VTRGSGRSVRRPATRGLHLMRLVVGCSRTVALPQPIASPEHGCVVSNCSVTVTLRSFVQNHHGLQWQAHCQTPTRRGLNRPPSDSTPSPHKNGSCRGRWPPDVLRGRVCVTTLRLVSWHRPSLPPSLQRQPCLLGGPIGVAASAVAGADAVTPWVSRERTRAEERRVRDRAVSVPRASVIRRPNWRSADTRHLAT
jgi:hypothetical protein